MDAGRLRLVGALYYAILARHWFNWGGHTQVTFVPEPWIELQGSGNVDLPGSGIALARADAGVFLAWTSTAPLWNAARGYLVPNVERKKFGVDLGVFFDRHETRYSPSDDPQHPRDAPISLLGAFAGLKWVRQWHTVTVNGERNNLRFVICADLMVAPSPLTDLPAGAPKRTRPGGRLGIEAAPLAGFGAFNRLEIGAMPGAAKPEFSLLATVGISGGL